MNILQKLYAKTLSKISYKMQAIPVLLMEYKPWLKDKNVTTHFLLPIESDEYIKSRCNEIAEHIRELYQEDIDKILKESNNESS
jgi:hypothetical protein